jgi:hypothetical protein
MSEKPSKVTREQLEEMAKKTTRLRNQLGQCDDSDSEDESDSDGDE